MFQVGDGVKSSSGMTPSLHATWFVHSPMEDSFPELYSFVTNTEAVIADYKISELGHHFLEGIEMIGRW